MTDKLIEDQAATIVDLRERLREAEAKLVATTTDHDNAEMRCVALDDRATAAQRALSERDAQVATLTTELIAAEEAFSVSGRSEFKPAIRRIRDALKAIPSPEPSRVVALVEAAVTWVEQRQKLIEEIAGNSAELKDVNRTASATEALVAAALALTGKVPGDG